MKIKKIIFLLILIVVLSIPFISCRSSTDVSKDAVKEEMPKKNDNSKKDDEKDLTETTHSTPTSEAKEIIETLLVENNIYQDGTVKLQVEILLSKGKTFVMNSYLDNLPDEGNSLKLYDVCYDEDIGQGYGSGILSSEIAVFKNDQTFAYIDTGLGVGDFELKELVCGDGELFVLTPKNIVKINTESLEVEKTIEVEDQIFAEQVKFFPELSYLIVPMPDLGVKKIYDSNSLEEIAEIELDLYNFFLTKDNNLLAIESVKQSGNFEVLVLDPKTFEKLESYIVPNDESITGVTFNSEMEELWLLSKKDEVFAYDLNDLEKNPVAFKVAPECKDIVYGDGYIVILTDNGFDTDDNGGYMGGITIIDSANKEILNEVKFLHIHKRIVLDNIKNIAYITNNNDNSIEKIDLRSGESLATIDIGSSNEHGVVSKDGTLFMSNRLGGSTVFSFNPLTEEFIEIETGQWPVGSAFSKSLNKVFTYDMLSSTITVIDSESSEVVDTFYLDEVEASSDAIGDLVYDSTRDILYAIIPEQNKIVVMDGLTGTKIGVINSYDYGYEKADFGGPAILSATLYEPTSKLFVYASVPKEIYVYDGLNEFELVETIKVEQNKGVKDFPYSFVADNYEDKIYLGNNIYDATTYEHLGELQYGTSVAAIDNLNGFMLTVGLDKDIYEKLYAVSLENDLLDEIDLNQNQYIHARFAYNKGKLYAFYMIPAEVWEYSIY